MTNCFVVIDTLNLSDDASLGSSGDGGAGGQSNLVEVEGSVGGAGGAAVISIDPTLGMVDAAQMGDGDGPNDVESMNLISNSTFQMGTTPWTEGWDDGTKEKSPPSIIQDEMDREFIVACIQNNPDEGATERYLGWSGEAGLDLPAGDYRLSARVLTGDDLPEYRIQLSGIDEPYTPLFVNTIASPGTSDQIRSYEFNLAAATDRLGVVFVAKGTDAGYLCVDDVQLIRQAGSSEE